MSRPRQVEGVYVSPCTSLLTSSELRGLGVSDEGRSRSYATVSECIWTNRNDDRLRIGVDKSRNLLVDTYRAPRPVIFVPIEIEGAPAVRQRVSTDTNTCNITAGLGPAESLEVDWTGSRPPQSGEDPCARAEEAVALVVRKLPPQR